MRKITITVGIPAYNEEKSIRPLLESILKQKQDTYNIHKIIVNLDGSTDSTKVEAKKVKDARILILDDKKRLGKTARMNQLIDLLTDDVLVLFDADVLLEDPHSIEHLVKPFQSKKIGLTGGKLIQKNVSNFMEKSIKASIDAYEEYAEKLNNGNNIFAVKGAILALSKQFAKESHIPEDVYANDSYLYFNCLARGYHFQFTKLATAYYHVPSNMKEQIEQNVRFVSSKDSLHKYFGNSVDKEYIRDKKKLYGLKLKYCILNPIHCIAIYGINTYSKMKAKQYASENHVKWRTVTSTKNGISKTQK